MPYKNREDRIAYYHRHQKGYMKVWRSESKKWNEYQKQYNKRRRKEGIYNGWDLVKSDPTKKEKSRQRSFEYWVENRGVLLKKHKEHTRLLTEEYIIRQLSKEIKVSAKLLRNAKTLIDLKRLVLLIKREIKCQQKTRI